MFRIHRDLQTLFQLGAVGCLADGQLLEQFITDRNQEAFEVLLERHGPMVWGVCRRVLSDHHDAEEAFQCAFLTLARRAVSVSPRDSVGHWLHGVALRTSLKIRTTSARRRKKERRLCEEREFQSLPRETWSELLPVLDQELGRLPERYRSPIVLCDLEGQTRGEAARQLGCPEGTVASRLARGRKLLARRLSRRVQAPSSATLALRLMKEAGASPSPDLYASTLEAANRFASDQASVGLVASQAGLVAGETVRIMSMTRSLAVAVAFAIGLAGLSLCFLAPASERPTVQNENQQEPPLQPQATEQDAARVRNEVKSVLERAVRSVPSVDDIEQRVWLLCEVARLQTRAGLDEELDATLKLAVKAAEESESDHRRIDVAGALVAAGHVRQAIDVASAVHRQIERERAFSVVAAGQAKAGDVPGAIRTASLIHVDDLKGDALCSITNALADEGDFQGALKTAGAIIDDGSRGQALVAIATRQFRAKQPGSAQTLKQARAIADKLPVVLDSRGEPGDNKPALLSELAGVLAASGELEDARQVARSITKAPWGDIAWKHIVAVQSERGETDAALQSAEQIKSGYEKGEALKTLVAALVRANELAKASRVIDSIEKGFWQVEALLEIAKGEARAGRPQAVTEVLARVRQEAEHIKDQPRVENLKAAAFGRLARAQGELGKEAAALAWIEAEPSSLIKSWSLLGLAEGLAKGLPLHTPRKPPLRDLPAEGNTAQAAAAAIGTRSASPPERKPSGSFKGKIILFGTQRADRAGILGIEAMNPAGQNQETIALLEKETSLLGGRVSPDGTRLAFDQVRGQGKAAHSEVWLLMAEGQRRKVCDDAYVAAFSQDGTRLAVFRQKNREFDNLIIDVETGKTTVLPLPKTDLVWDWSPDGQLLAVMAGNAGKVFEHPTKGTYPLRQIYLMKPDGSERSLVTTGPMLDSIAACFSPDGSRLAYQERRHHEGQVLHFGVVQARGTGRPRDLVQFTELYQGNIERRPHGSPCWSPDGKSIAWLVPRRKVQSAETHPELVFVTLATGKVERLDLFPHGLDWVQAIDWR